jgi:dTDP-4-amino-4,6-dideoxygalactose transaminase
VYHLYVIRTHQRNELRRHLADAGIATVLNYPKALPFYPAYAHLQHDHREFPVAHADQSRILSLPIYPEISDVMISYVCDKVAEFFEMSAVTVAT